MRILIEETEAEKIEMQSFIDLQGQGDSSNIKGDRRLAKPHYQLDVYPYQFQVSFKIGKNT